MSSGKADADLGWTAPGSNIALDFHGNPHRAKLVIFSDGNHHMALEGCCQAFLRRNPAVEDIFYATTPPHVLLRALPSGTIELGNLRLSASPHVFISPASVMKKVLLSGRIAGHQPYARNRGNVLLVRTGNPKGIRGVADLVREDLRFMISHPSNEKASHSGYRSSIVQMATQQGLPTAPFEALCAGTSGPVTFSERIHHREVPQALADGRADVAMVYYHLALRYSRIFPQLFSFVPLGGSAHEPQPLAGNATTTTHIAKTTEPGAWGGAFVEFMLGAEAGEIYRYHGLCRAKNE